MKCSECGYESSVKVRFCPKCRSYFVDADNPDSGIMWKGIQKDDGVIDRKPASAVYVSKDNAEGSNPVKPKTGPAASVVSPGSSKQTYPRFGWAVAALCLGAVNFVLTLLGVFVTDLAVFPIPVIFIMTIVAFALGRKHKLAWIGLSFLIFSFFIITLED